MLQVWVSCAMFEALLRYLANISEEKRQSNRKRSLAVTLILRAACSDHLHLKHTPSYYSVQEKSMAIANVV